jgi:hypothetical protein
MLTSYWPKITENRRSVTASPATAHYWSPKNCFDFIFIDIRRCIQKFPDWPPEMRTANGIAVTRCSCIAILWVSLVIFAAITLCVASQRVIPKVSVYFVIDSVRKILDTPSYGIEHSTTLNASCVKRADDFHSLCAVNRWLCSSQVSVTTQIFRTTISVLFMVEFHWVLFDIKYAEKLTDIMRSFDSLRMWRTHRT